MILKLQKSKGVLLMNKVDYQDAINRFLTKLNSKSLKTIQLELG